MTRALLAPPPRFALLLAAAAACAAPAPAAAQAFAFPPPAAGVFPALWFGASESGSLYVSAAQRAQLAMYSLVGWGWQLATHRTGFRHGETALAQAAASVAASSAAAASGNATAPAPPALFVYRHAQMAWRLFDVPRAADDAQAGGGALFLRNDDNSPDGVQCRQRIPSPPSGPEANGTSPLFAFAGAGGAGVTGAGTFFAEEVVAAELAVEGAVQGAFFDETDWSACGYSFANDGCANISDAFRAADLAAKLPALRATVDALNAAGIAPVLSSKNLLARAWDGLAPNATRPCVVPHDAYFNALSGAPYMRFYEFFAARGPDEDAATIMQIMIEAEAGIGLVARAPADSNSTCPNATSPSLSSSSSSSSWSSSWSSSQTSMSGVSLTGTPAGATRQPSMLYALASFMIAFNSPYSYFGISTGWLDSDWCWHKEAYALAASCGLSVTTAQRSGTYFFVRGFFACFVSVDTLAGVGVITYCGERGANETGCR
jgi:hypothetical protein